MANDPLSEVIRRATYAADGMSDFCRASDQMRPGDLRRLLAAAQAYSCRWCSGLGSLRDPVDPESWCRCQNCLDFRKMADEGDSRTESSSLVRAILEASYRRRGAP